MSDVRILQPGDEAALGRFLSQFADSSMILRANLHVAGLVDRGEAFQGTYFAEFNGDQVIGVAAQYWNGNLVLQAPTDCTGLVKYSAALLPRPVRGLLGPWQQAVEARNVLGLSAAPTSIASREGLFALDLTRLIVPEVLTAGRVECRHSRDEELDLLIRWNVAFAIEATGATDTPDQRASCQERVERNHARRTLWVLTDSERPVAMNGFNAALPDCVQVGPVWTPPEHRGRGYARSVVAGSLMEARDQRVTRALLFTGTEAARRAYRAIGFERVGDYGLILFAGPQWPHR